MVEILPLSCDNFSEVLALSVHPEQSGFVAPNVRSIAESKVYPYLEPAVVGLDGEVVGFCRSGQDPDTGRVYLVRLMIDARHQGKGYGREATRLLIEELRRRYQREEIFVCVVPANAGAERLYRSLGFSPTGERDEDGEIVMRLDS